MIKRILAFVLCFVVVFAFVGCNEEKKPTVISAKAGDIISVPVNITNNPGIVAAQVEVEFDTEKFEYVTANNGEILGECQANQVAGKISVVLLAEFTASMRDITKTGALVTLKLRVKEAAKGSTEQFKLTRYQFVNINEQEVKAVVEIPKVTIK